jgi:threonine dehydrogenase-like Zn-dependent dehydrogenase
MKAQRLVFPREHRCEIEEFSINLPLNAREVLVRNRVSLVSAGTELSMFTRTHRGIDVPGFGFAKYPFKPGYSIVGEIVEAGPDVTLKPGTRVYHTGPHATYARVALEDLLPLPVGLSEENATFIQIVRIAMTAPWLEPVRFGENVVVMGMGAVGNLCAQLCKLAGAGCVAGADLSGPRLEHAKACGIERVFNLAQKPLVEWVKELEPQGATLVVEAVGIPPTIDACLKAVAKKGRVILLGSPRSNMEFDPYFDVHRKAIRVIGAHGMGVDAETKKRDDPFLVSLLNSQKLKVEPLITHRIPFVEAQQAYEGLRDRKDEFLGVILRYA